MQAARPAAHLVASPVLAVHPAASLVPHQKTAQVSRRSTKGALIPARLYSSVLVSLSMLD